MGSADYFAAGEWNFYCDLCGKKAKSSTATKTWDGHYVCKSHKEVRNPQDFIRGVSDNRPIPWSRGDVPPVFVTGATSLATEQGVILLTEASVEMVI